MGSVAGEEGEGEGLAGEGGGVDGAQVRDVGFLEGVQGEGHCEGWGYGFDGMLFSNLGSTSLYFTEQKQFWIALELEVGLIGFSTFGRQTECVGRENADHRGYMPEA